MTKCRVVGRIYLNPDKSLYTDIALPPDFERLLMEVAHKLEKDEDGQALYIGKVVCRARTKWTIIRRANKLIAHAKTKPSDDTLASFVSMRQFDHMVRTFNGELYHLSSYSMIILHTMYMLLIKGCSKEIKQLLDQYARFIYEFATEYYYHNPTDDLAKYLLDCYAAIVGEFKGGAPISPEVLPAIPKRMLGDLLDEMLDV